ncbi:MAG: hypothetical protein ABL868_08990 [Sulfuriferula sp.]
MSKLHLDYQRSIQPFPWAGVLLLVLALAALIATAMYYRNLSAQVMQWESRVDRMEHTTQRQLPAAQSREPMTADRVLEVKRVNEVLRQLSVPWDSLFQALESVDSKEVTLLVLEPDMEKRLVKISAEAKTMTAMLDYIKQLENRDVLGTVYLQSHHVQLQDPEKPVRFVLLASWRGK